MATVQIIVGLDGKINFVVAQGSEFDPAKAAIEQVIGGLKMEGIDFAEVGEVERHRHDNPPAHAHEHIHN